MSNQQQHAPLLLYQGQNPYPELQKYPLDSLLGAELKMSIITKTAHLYQEPTIFHPGTEPPIPRFRFLLEDKDKPIQYGEEFNKTGYIMCRGMYDIATAPNSPEKHGHCKRYTKEYLTIDSTHYYSEICESEGEWNYGKKEGLHKFYTEDYINTLSNIQVCKRISWYSQDLEMINCYEFFENKEFTTKGSDNELVRQVDENYRYILEEYKDDQICGQYKEVNATYNRATGETSYKKYTIGEKNSYGMWVGCYRSYINGMLQNISYNQRFARKHDEMISENEETNEIYEHRGNYQRNFDGQLYGFMNNRDSSIAPNPNPYCNIHRHMNGGIKKMVIGNDSSKKALYETFQSTKIKTLYVQQQNQTLKFNEFPNKMIEIHPNLYEKNAVTYYNSRLTLDSYHFNIDDGKCWFKGYNQDIQTKSRSKYRKICDIYPDTGKFWTYWPNDQGGGLKSIGRINNCEVTGPIRQYQPNGKLAFISDSMFKNSKGSKCSRGDSGKFNVKTLIGMGPITNVYFGLHGFDNQVEKSLPNQHNLIGFTPLGQIKSCHFSDKTTNLGMKYIWDTGNCYVRQKGNFDIETGQFFGKNIQKFNLKHKLVTIGEYNLNGKNGYEIGFQTKNNIENVYYKKYHSNHPMADNDDKNRLQEIERLKDEIKKHMLSERAQDKKRLVKMFESYYPKTKRLMNIDILKRLKQFMVDDVNCREFLEEIFDKEKYVWNKDICGQLHFGENLKEIQESVAEIEKKEKKEIRIVGVQKKIDEKKPTKPITMVTKPKATVGKERPTTSKPKVTVEKERPTTSKPNLANQGIARKSADRFKPPEKPSRPKTSSTAITTLSAKKTDAVPKSPNRNTKEKPVLSKVVTKPSTIGLCQKKPVETTAAGHSHQVSVYKFFFL